MEVILVPGLWLTASSWDPVLPALREAGHTPVPLTLPGVGGTAAETADIIMDDWVAAVAAEIDRHEGPVGLVGHSGGGNVVWGAAAARPDRVADAEHSGPGADLAGHPRRRPAIRRAGDAPHGVARRGGAPRRARSVGSVCGGVGGDRRRHGRAPRHRSLAAVQRARRPRSRTRRGIRGGRPAGGCPGLKCSRGGGIRGGRSRGSGFRGGGGQ
ncbi:alpha/beta fold hydrolase [Microbacterium lacticum]